MKNTLVIFSIALLVAACGGSEEAPDVAKLKGEIAQLEKEKTEAVSKVSEVDTKLKDKKELLDSLTNKAYKNIGGVAVSAEKIVPTSWAKNVEVHGFILSGNNIMVMPEAQGMIRQITVKEGAQVRKGQVLARIDTEILRKNLQEAKKQLELVDTLFKKQQILRNKNVGSEIDFLTAKNNKESLEQRISTIKTQISKSTVTAPISGKVETIFPKVGEMASPGSPLLRIVNTNVGAYIESDVSEAYFNQISEGDSVEINFPTIGEKEVKAKVTYKGNYINNANRTFKVQINIDSKGKKYPANLFAVVKLTLEKLDKQVVIPTNIVQRDDKSDYVFVVAKNSKGEKIAKRRDITVSKSADNESVVSEGLKFGEEVIVKAVVSKLMTTDKEGVLITTDVK